LESLCAGVDERRRSAYAASVPFPGERRSNNMKLATVASSVLLT
jgi:hypothetical protein